ncbi:ribbon-helix-helix domain-containing protein [Bradyrhizobium sp. UFLA05-153]
MPASLIKAIDAFAKSQGGSRSDAVRQLIQRGLQAWIEDQR